MRIHRVLSLVAGIVIALTAIPAIAQATVWYVPNCLPNMALITSGRYKLVADPSQGDGGAKYFLGGGDGNFGTWIISGSADLMNADFQQWAGGWVRYLGSYKFDNPGWSSTWNAAPLQIQVPQTVDDAVGYDSGFTAARFVDTPADPNGNPILNEPSSLTDSTRQIQVYGEMIPATGESGLTLHLTQNLPGPTPVLYEEYHRFSQNIPIAGGGFTCGLRSLDVLKNGATISHQVFTNWDRY